MHLTARRARRCIALVGGSANASRKILKGRAYLCLPGLVVQYLRNLIPRTRSQLRPQNKSNQDQNGHARQNNEEP
jgi:hypothetical protein